jgi:hypothetical protein
MHPGNPESGRSRIKQGIMRFSKFLLEKSNTGKPTALAFGYDVCYCFKYSIFAIMSFSLCPG